KRLGSFHMRNGMGVRIDRDFSSPYRIGKLESGQFALFGEGNVKVALVGGATLMPPNGYKTWQESRDSLIEGVRWMIEHGIFPTPLCMRLGPGSQYGNNPANRAKLPPTEFYLEVALAHDEAMVEYNRYGTMNKLAHCPLDCFDNHYSGDLGILRLAGNMGNWLVGTIPEKAN
ncbi:MAG: hypothetical protein Q7O66_12995, partial [Dehalococcoidia bacterium]|nr:hypothetical protein [Dehalococcoidia bacterium]